jgi:hypothetical protein
MEVRYQLHAPVVLSWWKILCTYWTFNNLATEPVWAFWKREMSLVTSGNRPPDCQAHILAYPIDRLCVRKALQQIYFLHKFIQRSFFRSELKKSPHLRNLKFHYYVQKNPKAARILSPINPVHIVWASFCNLNSNTILPPKHKSPTLSLPFRISC